MVAGKLYTYPDNFRAQKALVAAKYSGAELTVPADFVFGETNKTPEFLKKFPLGKVPAFESSDGVLLTESNAIAYYVATDELRGADAVSKAQIVQWMSWADNEILPASCTWVFPCMGIMQFNKVATDRAKEDVKSALKCLNDHLLTHTFLVGERISLADIATACTLLNLYKHVLEPNFRKSFGNVNRWFTTVINQPNVKAVIGDFALCTKMAEFDAKKFAEFSGKGDNKKGKGEKKKEEKKKAEPKPKQEKKKPEPKEEDDELGLALPAKKKDPLDELPKGSFDMEEWKRFFSNNDEEEAVKWFWEHFDTENYSIWKGDYNYNDELTLTFMSANLIGGMFQRLEKMKKNAFASACLFGESHNSSISGVWIWRGQGLAFDLSEDWQIDSGSYTWRKLDPASEECKKLVHQYWVWEGTDDKGRAFNQGKILK
jgi:elongation factor 1-gamma